MLFEKVFKMITYRDVLNILNVHELSVGQTPL